MAPPSLIALVLLTVLLSTVTTWTLIKANHRFRLLALPREDRWHSHATPNSGGLAIFLSCATAYFIAFPGAYPAVALGAACLCLVGFLDDRIQLRPAVKFTAQVIVTLLVVLNGVVFPATPWHTVNLAFSFLWIVGITNAFNLIDNMDGLCAGVAIIINLFRFCLLASSGHWQDAALSAVLAAAFAGFLVFNYNPAMIFMGDCGSMFAGFTLAALTIAGPLAHTKVFAATIAYPALTFIYPIFDTTLVCILRKAAARPVSVGGRDHSSHRLASLGVSERKVVWILWIMTALGGVVGLMVQWMPIEVIVAAAVLVGSLTMFGIFLGRLPAYPVDPRAAASWKRRLIPSLRAGISLIVDILVAGVALLTAFLIRFESGLSVGQIEILLRSLPVVMACHALACWLFKTFLIPWRSFSLRDGFWMACAVMLGAAAGWAALYLLQGSPPPRSVMVLYTLLCLSLAAALRLSLRVLEDLFQGEHVGRQRVAVFGANQEGEMLARLLEGNSTLNAKPVVFFDYDAGKGGMRIRGIPVRYCKANLQKLATEYEIGAVLLPGQSGSNGYDELERDCLQAGLDLLALNISLRRLDTALAEAPSENRS